VHRHNFEEMYSESPVPTYLERCKNLGLNPGTQECILQFDLYKVTASAFSLKVSHLVILQVHVCEEFTSWLKETYPFIRLNIIPAGCTSKVQVADVVLNRPFKSRL